MHPYLLHNGQILPSDSPRIATPGQTGLLNGWGVFSTLRVIDGILFAFERHFRRMRRDADLMHVPFPNDPAAFQQQLDSLIDANRAENATLRVAIVRNRGGMFESPNPKPEYDVVAFTTPLRDWGTSARLGVVPQARHAANEFAGTKILSWAQNLTWYERAHADGFDEVVLLNEHGDVSECTSANIFAVFGTQVVTPPVLESGCLPGVTRAVLLEDIALPEIQITERSLRLEDLKDADEIFITSSTREVLPVSHVEGLPLRKSNYFISQQLRNALQAYMRAYASRQQSMRIPP